MMIRATRESDGETFTFDDLPWNGAYVVSANVQIPQPATNNLSGGEYNGAHGGYTTAARYERRVFDLKFTMDGRRSDRGGIVSLISQGRAFFRIARDDLAAELYTLDFYTSDIDHGTFRLRHGAIAAPFSAPFSGRDTIFAEGSVSFIFGDPFLYPIDASSNASGSVVVFTVLPIDGAGAATRGRQWSTTGAQWAATGAQWRGSASGTAVSVNFTTETTAPAELHISGQCTNPVVINTTTGAEFSYSGTISAGQTLDVDTSGNATIAGVPAPGIYSGLLTARGGVNEFVMSADNIDANASARILLRGTF